MTNSNNVTTSKKTGPITRMFALAAFFAAFSLFGAGSSAQAAKLARTGVGSNGSLVALGVALIVTGAGVLFGSERIARRGGR